MTIEPQTNPYGVIPFLFLRLKESSEFWTDGLFRVMEKNLNINKNKLLADINASFNSSPIKLGTNLGKQIMDIAPDKMILIDGITQGDGQLIPPSIDFVNPMPQYDSIYNYAKTLESDVYSSQGFPASMINSEGATILSGVSRELERKELTEARINDIEFLADFEKEMFKLVALVYNTDSNTNPKTAFPLEFNFSIDYAEERVYTEAIVTGKQNQ